MNSRLIVFCLLMVCQLLCCMALSIITPFFPPYAISMGISEDVIGVIFAANPFGAIIASIILGKILNERNRFNFMIFALILQGLGLYLFILTKYQYENWQIILTAVVSRIINGFATSCFLTPLYAYIPVLYPEDVESKISFTEVSAALGFLIGPVVGSLVYSIGGYIAPFAVFGTLALLLVPVIGCFLKSKGSLKKGPKKQTLVVEAGDDQQIASVHSEHKVEDTQPKPQTAVDDIPLDYLKILSIYPILMTTFIGWAPNVMFNYQTAVIANFFETTYGAKPENVGYYIVVLPTTYTITSIIFGSIRKRRRLSIFLGSLMMGISAFFNGPTKLITSLNPNLYISLASYGGYGIGASPVVVYTIPELNDLLLSYYPDRPTQCANMASALFNIVLYAGELIAPFIGGLLTRYYSFETAAMYLGFFILIIAIFYIPVLFIKPPATWQLRKQGDKENLIENTS